MSASKIYETSNIGPSTQLFRSSRNRQNFCSYQMMFWPEMLSRYLTCLMLDQELRTLCDCKNFHTSKVK